MFDELLTNGASVKRLRSVVVFLAAAAIVGCEQRAPTQPVAGNNRGPESTSNRAPIGFPESATAIGLEFKLIPAGSFTMGDETVFGATPHEVTLTKPFKLGVHEVTQAQYEQLMGNNPSHFPGANNPVEKISWDDAVEFCRKLSELPGEKAAGNVYRLPSQAEWEYACRAGTATKYSFGDDESELGDFAWFRDNSSRETHAVGGKKRNPWGLYDMYGNVWEWCQDWDAAYPSESVTDPTGPASGSSRVFRGGSWSSPTGLCSSAYRRRYGPVFRSAHRGFRVCLTMSSE